MEKKTVTISGKLTIKKYVPTFENIFDCDEAYGEDNYAESFVEDGGSDEDEVWFNDCHGKYFYAVWEKIDKIEVDGEKIELYYIDRERLFQEQLNDLYKDVDSNKSYAEILVKNTAKLDAKVNYEIYLADGEEFDAKAIKLINQEFDDKMYQDCTDLILNAMEISFRGRNFASQDIYDVIENAEYDNTWSLEQGLEL